MSIVFFNPAWLLNVLSGSFGVISGLVLLILPLTALASCAALFNWYDLLDHIGRVFFSLNFLQSLILSMLTANLLGKIAQGITMAGCGNAPEQFGIKLVFGVLPRFFIPIGGIRALDYPEQRRCYAAPLLARLLMFASGLLIWTILRRSGSGAADAALAFAITGLGAFIFTANPVWRADGYRWITARLAMPKLREESYRLLGLVLRGKRQPEALTRGKIRLLFGYAIASIIYTALLVGTVVTTLAITLETKYQGTGVAIFAVIVGMVVLYFTSISSRRRARENRKVLGRRKVMPSTQKSGVSCYKRVKEVTDETPSSETTEQMRSHKKEPRQSDLDALIGTNLAPKTETQVTPFAASGTDLALEAILPHSTDAPATEEDDLNQILDAAFPPQTDTPPVAALVRPRTQLPVKHADAPPAPVKVPLPPARSAREQRASDDLDSMLGVGQARRKDKPLWRKLLIWAVLIGALTYAALQPYPFTVGGAFVVQSVVRSQVRARTSGEVTSLLAGEGDWVTKGQVLAQLSDWNARRDIAIRESELARLQATLASLIAGPKPEEIALTQQIVAAAEANMLAARWQFERQEQLFQSGTIAQKALDDARTALTVAQAEKDRADASLSLLQSSALESDIAGARASIMRAEQELAFSKLQLEHTKIRAVADGQIVTNLNTMALGAFLNEGDHFADIADDLTAMVAIEVPETQIDEVAIDAPAVLKLWSAPETDLIGTVKRVAPAAEERDFGRVMRVLVEVPNTDGLLASNMTGFGKITVDERPAWRVFTRGFVRFFEVEIWSWLP